MMHIEVTEYHMPHADRSINQIPETYRRAHTTTTQRSGQQATATIGANNMWLPTTQRSADGRRLPAEQTTRGSRRRQR